MSTHTSTTSRRLTRTAGCLVAGLVVFTVGLATPQAANAVSSPGGLSVRQPNSATPILAWKRVPGAKYRVQVDNDPGFGSPEVDESTNNAAFVPTRNLVPGTQHWRVRAETNDKQSDWARSSFTVTPVGVPVPTSPANGAVLPQPDRPPLLRWQTSRGAKEYVVEVDGDADFIGSKTWTTRGASLAVPDPLPAGDYYWRVTASLGDGINSVPSAVSRFDLGALRVPTLVYPLDDIDAAIEDVVFDWHPVSGAQTYDLQVATDATFNNIAFDAKNLKGTRFSPATTLFNDQFWWRVRAVDLAGQPTPWASGHANFERNWLDQPQPVWPQGAMNIADANVPAATNTKRFYQWTPVQHATKYELEMSTDSTFSSNNCVVRLAGTTWAPRGPGSCQPSGAVMYWHVRPLDEPYRDGGLPGLWSPTQKVKWEPPAETGPVPAAYTPVTGLKVAMTGTGASPAGPGCAAVQCGNLSATPVMSWNRVEGAVGYVVWTAVDANFTTSPVPKPIKTTNTYATFAESEGDDRKALPESEAGKPYVWFVQPCYAAPVNGGACGPSPVSSSQAGWHSYRKVSPAITGMVSSPADGSDITFSWQDYIDTNKATSTYGETGQQSAKVYRIQVDNEPSFAEPLLEQATVDQTTFTSGDKLYPEGALYWRVQALDAQDNGLTWSSTASLIKSTPPVSLVSPINGVAVSGATPFEWQPQGFASSYEVEVYKNADTAFSSSNRVVSARVANPAYTPAQPMPAAGSAYVWRVRRYDSSGNPGPWASGSFVSLGSVPELLAPANGPMLPKDGVLMEWSDVPGAAKYVLALRNSTGDKREQSTVGTAYAPSDLQSGTWTWQVTAMDSSDRPLGSSATRTFRVDAVAPKVVKVKPGKLKAKSSLKVVFTEPVKGLSKKTVKLLHIKPSGKKKKPVKIKVKVKAGGKVALLDPKGRLKKGTYLIAFTNTAITDAGGNALEDKQVNGPTR